MKRLWQRRLRPAKPAVAPSPSAAEIEAERGRRLVEESREIVLVLDERDRVVAASRRAREAFEGLIEGAQLTEEMLRAAGALVPFRVPYEVDGRRETLLYLSEAGDLAAYEELRAGFTAAVSHELRTPLARLLAVLETAALPGTDREALIEQARAEVGEIGELIEDILFLSELESGRQVVSFGATPALPLLREVAEHLAENAARAGIRVVVEGDDAVKVPLRPRMIRVVVTNLAENAIRYAGAGATLTLSAAREDGAVVVTAADDGIGVDDAALSRVFERFYRADRARASRGTGLGLAIVKHVVTAAGGTVDASGGRGRGLTVRCVFPVP